MKPEPAARYDWIVGRFGENGELFFEIELIVANGERFAVEALLDTGFTTGWLALNAWLPPF